MEQTAEHAFDERSKSFYAHYFENLQIRADRQFEVFSRGRSIDLLTECVDSDFGKLQSTCFSHFRRVNALELKGPHDPLTTNDLNLILMRSWGIGGRDRVERNEAGEYLPFLSNQTIQEIANYPSKRTITIICVTRPDKILNDLEIQPEFGFTPTGDPGVYHSSKLLIPVWIIHPDELAIVPKNYPLLPLARGQKLRQFIDLCLENEWNSYLQFVIDIAKSIDPSEVFAKIMEMLHMKYKLKPEVVLQFDELLRDRPELMWEMPTFREAVEQASHIAALRADREGEKRGKLQEKQHSLTLLLQHKFPDVPGAIIAQIQSTDDLAQLERWTLQILTARTWQEMFSAAVAA